MAEQTPGLVDLVLSESPIQRLFITLWNRIEGRPHTENFDRAMKAEVRDPLWMLSKQWQMGEFQGEDAGSAILSKVHIKTTALTKYQSGENTISNPTPTVPFDDNTPLEVQVEHQEIPFVAAGREMSLDLRLLMGRHWLKLIKRETPTLRTVFVQKYAFSLPKPDNKKDHTKCAHLDVWQTFAAVSNVLDETDPSAPEFRIDSRLRNCMDGYKLYQYLKQDSSHHAYDGLSGTISDIDKDALDLLAPKFISWFEQLYYQPTNAENPSWKPSYLEYQFNCAAPNGENEKVLVADEYYHGHLDWYNLDFHNNKTELPLVEGEVNEVEKSFTLPFIPTPITFPGMPHNRWWAFEDWKTNLGTLQPDRTDINQLMLLDFALNYANDWFMLPFTLPVGSLANVEGLMVTNVFGEKIWIDAAGEEEVDGEKWNRWSMFHLNSRGNLDVPEDLILFLLPAAPKVLEGKPLESIYMLRDEVANMVWGVEDTIPLATGKSKRGKEAGIELQSKLQQAVDKRTVALPDPPAIVPNEAKIKYQIVNSVPEHWIPFCPVHVKDSNREIQLQRSAMPRILKGDDQPPKKIEPRTNLLREGLDDTDPKSYYINEDTIWRAGIKIQKSFQRTRWYNGEVYTWLGFRKKVGRGEGYSGLAFDQIVPK